jgi:hypothetical protein
MSDDIRPVKVNIDQPFASTPGEPTLRAEFGITRGMNTGFRVSPKTAKELIEGLQKGLDDIAAGEGDPQWYTK